MSEESISLYDLLNVSIGTPQVGAVNFGALHALLHAVLKQLDLQQVKTRWRSTAPGRGHSDAPAAGTASEEDLQAEDGQDIHQGRSGEQEVQAGSEQQEGKEAPPSPTSSSSRAVDSRMNLLPRVQSCEEDVSRALKLLQQLHDQSDCLKEEIQQLHHQQKTAEGQAEVVSAAEKCCLRVDTLEDTVRSLTGVFQRCPQWVTWDDLQSALLSGNLPEEHLNAEADDPASRNVTARKTTPPCSSSPAASSSAATSGPTLALQDRTAVAAAPDSPPADREQGGVDLLGATGGLEPCPKAVEVLRDLSQLRGKFSRLHARVVELEEGKLEQSQLTHITELIADKEFQDSSDQLMNQLMQQKSFIEKLSSDQEKNMQLVDDVQTAFLQLQAQCEKLGDCNRNLLEEKRENESHIQELLKNMKELEEKKADKLTVEREIKAQKSAVESKVSHLQFDSEQLGAMLKELLKKVSGQEQDWHRVLDRLSSEMDCKLNRIELDSMKKQLENRWKNISEKLQTQEGLESDDAAALRKQLVDRFNCLSCDRPIVKYTHTQHFMKLPATPGFPAHRSIRPFTVYALEQFRQHYRSERISGLSDYSHMTVSRNCGGSHTVNSASQRRQSTRHHTHAEVDLALQSEEVDIVGLDGHIYKGRLSAPAVRNTEISLPTISAKDGLCKPKDKVLSRKPATSPETAQGAPTHPAQGAKGAQCSRSASSSSGREWPVSVLGCTSTTSFTADAEVKTQAGEPPGL